MAARPNRPRRQLKLSPVRDIALFTGKDIVRFKPSTQKADGTDQPLNGLCWVLLLAAASKNAQPGERRAEQQESGRNRHNRRRTRKRRKQDIVGC